MVPGKGEHPWGWPGDTPAPEPGGERDGSLSIPECWQCQTTPGSPGIQGMLPEGCFHQIDRKSVV